MEELRELSVEELKRLMGYQRDLDPLSKDYQILQCRVNNQKDLFLDLARTEHQFDEDKIKHMFNDEHAKISSELNDARKQLEYKNDVRYVIDTAITVIFTSWGLFADSRGPLGFFSKDAVLRLFRKK